MALRCRMPPAPDAHLEELNAAQREAVLHDPRSPLLVIAGAGSGKTKTLAHRVAALLLGGADPRRVLLLTFSRRAATEMTARTRRIVAKAQGPATEESASPATGGARRRGASTEESASPATGGARRRGASTGAETAAGLTWSGTFHAIANRLLRLHAEELQLDPSFTVLDRSDAADTLDVLRGDLGLSRTDRRFPRKATCAAIYSRVVNTHGAGGSAASALERVLKASFPWCAAWTEELRRLFAAYAEVKQRQNVLDYDDLLLTWFHLMAEPSLAARVRSRFDHVLVDEYQDTNALQAAILFGLSPDGAGLTVVGDDAQAIYSFRAADVRNILDFPKAFTPPARVVTLAQNYRSTQPILDAANGVIALAKERFAKELFTERGGAQRPRLVTAEDEQAQVDYVVERVLAARETGIPLKRMAVLMRASHHSDALEVELGRRNVPYVKYGGLKFLEASHVKDVMCVLRWAENPRDAVAAFRTVQLLPGVGPAVARRVGEQLAEHGHRALAIAPPPRAVQEAWQSLVQLLEQLHQADWQAQLGLVRAWYQPHLERLHDDAPVRAGDLEQLEQISSHYPTRERFLSELALDPPEATGDHAGPPLLDEDWLVLSTIHSAKGQEWDHVFVLNCADGCIPSDMATRNASELEEERRLLYVAMTRARDELHLVHPLRFHVHGQRPGGDRHVYAPRTRFIPDALLDRFERSAHVMPRPADAPLPPGPASVDVGARLRGMWS